jgi:hypothetical protein
MPFLTKWRGSSHSTKIHSRCVVLACKKTYQLSHYPAKMTKIMDEIWNRIILWC